MKHGLPFEPLVDLFATVLQGVSPSPPRDVLRQLVSHWLLVKQWNARVNLTAIDDDEEAAWLHYRDSLEALSVLPDGPIVDLGSGAGYPGFPIGIASPDRSVTLLEPRRKRISFLETAVARLKTQNIRVIQGRSTDEPPEPFAAAVTRATFSDADDLEACLDWVAPGGILIAFRSQAIQHLPRSRVHAYDLRGDARVLQLIEKL